MSESVIYDQDDYFDFDYAIFDNSERDTIDRIVHTGYWVRDFGPRWVWLTLILYRILTWIL